MIRTRSACFPRARSVLIFFSRILVFGVAFEHNFYPQTLSGRLKCLQCLFQGKTMRHQWLYVHFLWCKHCNGHGPPARQQKRCFGQYVATQFWTVRWDVDGEFVHLDPWQILTYCSIERSLWYPPPARPRSQLALWPSPAQAPPKPQSLLNELPKEKEDQHKGTPSTRIRIEEFLQGFILAD